MNQKVRSFCKFRFHFKFSFLMSENAMIVAEFCLGQYFHALIVRFFLICFVSTQNIRKDTLQKTLKKVFVGVSVDVRLRWGFWWLFYIGGK